MWEFWKYFSLVEQLAKLWKNLSGVRARTATSTDYQLAADAILANPKVVRWLAKRTPEEQDQFTAGLPMFVFALDAMTE